MDPNTLLQKPKVITCIVPTHMGLDLVDALYHELGVTTVNVHRGRGASGRSGEIADEMEIVVAVVEADRADEVFAFLHERAEIATTPHRFMYQSALNVASWLTLPETLEEEKR